MQVDKATSIYVGNTDIKDHAIIYDKSAESKALADFICSQIEKHAGYQLKVVSTDTPTTKKHILIKVIEKSGNEGFYVTEKDGNLEIASEFDNKLFELGKAYFEKMLTKASGRVTLTSAIENARDVNYEMFGAIGDGDPMHDDVPAILACHEYANLYGHNVVLNKGKSYYFGEVKSTIPIKTNVDFGDARFTIDDREISSANPARAVVLFNIQSPYDTVHLSIDESEIIKELNRRGGITRNTKNIDLGLGYPALLKIVNTNKKVYIRYGANANRGADQKEVVLIDKYGNIDPSTPFIFEFEEITDIYVFRTDLEPMTVSGGIFTLRANQADSDNKYYSRNFAINRSNLTVKDVTYKITDERPGEYEGDAYMPFLRVENANNVLFYNCRLDGHRTYYIPGTKVGMGSKTINATSSNNVVWKNCIQTNFFTDESETAITPRLWGIMSSNYSKNLAYIDSTLSRFDAHAGVYNATIKGCRISSGIRIVGSGQLTLEDCEFFAPNVSNTVISTREDFGSFWNGDVLIKNLHIHTVGDTPVNMFVGRWYNHYFGYPTELASEITIDNFTVDKDLPVNLFSNSFVNELNASLTTPDNINPMTPPKKVTIKNCANTEFILPTASEYFKDTEFIIQ